MRVSEIPAHSQARRRDRGPYAVGIALLGISGLALCARLYHLQSQSLWMDEIAILTDAQAFHHGGMAALARADHVAPLYAIIVALMSAGGRASAWTLRIPSVIAGTLTVPLFYVLGIRLFRSRAVGVIASLLVACSPFAVWFGQEARMYALLLFFVCAYVVLAWPVLSRPLRWSELALLTLVTSLGLYCHHYMIFVSVAFGVFLLILLGPKSRRFWTWTASQIIALLAFSYWIVLTMGELHDHAGVVKPAVWAWIPYTLYAFTVGFSLGPSVREMHTAGALHAAMAHALPLSLVIVAAAAATIAGLREALRAERRTSGLWCILWLAVPISLAVLATYATNISYNVRYVIGAFPPFVLFLALAIEATIRSARRAFGMLRARTSGALNQAPRSWRPSLALWTSGRFAAVAALLAVTGASLSNLYFDDAYAKDDVRDAARFLREHLAPTDLLVLDNSRASPIFTYYGEPLSRSAVQIAGIRNDGVPTAMARKISTFARQPGRRIWLIEYRPWETDPGGSVPRLIAAQSRFQQQYHWPGVSLRLYRTLP